MKEVSEKEKKHHTRRLSIKEGIFWSVKSSLGDHYLAPFSIAMNASNSIVAILNSLWNLGPISQLFGSRLVGKRSRKSILTKTMAVESFGWLLIALISFLFYKQILVSLLPIFLLVAVSLFIISGGIGHPSWFSWIGDVVDEKYRGRWFAKRSTILSFTTIILAITAAFLLEYLKKINQPVIGFIFLFSIAFLARFTCIKIIRSHYEPKLKLRKKDNYSLKEFFQDFGKTNFGKFAAFRLMFAFSMGLTSPLVAIYLLRYLGFDYITFILIAISGTMFSVITLNLWGKISDKYGNYKVIALTTLIIPLTPLLWILSPSRIYLFIVPAIFGGTAWTAFLISSGNFIYDNISKQKRGKAISYFNLMIGLGAFAGGLTSAYLIKVINTSWIEPLFLIFLIGTLARMIVVGIWIPLLKEIKHKRKLKNFKELGNLVIKQAKPIILEDIHEIVEIKNYISEK
ncbi:MAG: MFS transporter [Nanoarchaeota archaeon]|nr:MFS transporter [Nanoarchaeota archaeon]